MIRFRFNKFLNAASRPLSFSGHSQNIDITNELVMFGNIRELFWQNQNPGVKKRINYLPFYKNDVNLLVNVHH
jgi:hypothetical protein